MPERASADFAGGPPSTILTWIPIGIIALSLVARRNHENPDAVDRFQLEADYDTTMSAAITVFLPRLPKRGLIPGRRRGWTVAQLNQEIAAAGFDVKLRPFDTEKQGGYVLCTIGGARSGFEYYADSIDAYQEVIDDMRDDGDFPYSEEDLTVISRHASVVQMVIHYRPREYAAAAIAAACLAKMVGGTVLDEPVWKWSSGHEALAWARDVFAKHGNE